VNAGRAPVADTSPRRPDRRAVGLLTGGHFFNDVNQGVVPALLPFLVMERGLTFAAAGGLVMAATVLSSVVQPAFGWFADTRSAPWVIPAGLFAAGAGIALVAVAPSYVWIVAAVLLSGLGVAAFHPESARAANHASGDRTATVMSVFAVGGNAGYAAGPLLATPLLVAFGVSGVGWLLLPAAATALVLLVNLGRFRSKPPPRADDGGRPGHSRHEWSVFGRLTGVVVLRSIAFFGLVTFLPLYWIDVLGGSAARGNAALTTLLVFGIAGTLGGGWLGDRYGSHRVVLVGMVATSVSVATLVLSGMDGWAALVAVCVIGAAVYLPFGVMVSLGQAYLWRRIGTASGVTIGLSMTVGGLAAPALGVVGDRWGLGTTLLVVAAIPLVGAALATTLPAPPGPEARTLVDG
jgi:MFS transporter, FSR family, fosmidomycin resistance protein